MVLSCDPFFGPKSVHDLLLCRCTGSANSVFYVNIITFPFKIQCVDICYHINDLLIVFDLACNR